MSHVVLVGDSIFDNGSYVPGGTPVIDQLARSLPRGWKATLLAVDGADSTDTLQQLRLMPQDATHVFVSAGGNDAYNASGVLNETAGTVLEAARLLSRERTPFEEDYRNLLDALVALGKKAVVCTVYDAVPGLGEPERAALALFNDVIIREAVARGLPVIDLRIVCATSGDYSSVSPIEPSDEGGRKIARVISEVAVGHDFSSQRTSVYS